MRVLVVNAGSSSLKLRLMGPADEVERSADTEPGAPVSEVLAKWPIPDAVGHRVVHGGTRFRTPVLVDPSVRNELEALTALAPLHQPKSLAALDAVSTVLPTVPAVACFDTAFHAAIPEEASTYAVPKAWRERYSVRRYGFHGLSHSGCAARVAQLSGARRIVTAHLGAGASLAAVLDGCCVDTTMGFTPLEGLVMATRSGTVDPGLVLWLQEHEQMSAREVAEQLEWHSGLLALAGTSDMREVLAAASRAEADAVLAREVYVHRLVAGVAAMAAAIGGLEALAFTGGVGENADALRARAAERLAFLGVGIDPAANAMTTDGEISEADAPVRTFVVPAREDIAIAGGTRVVVRER